MSIDRRPQYGNDRPERGGGASQQNLEKEASFYGAMDGASKFVKGDAVAGIIIVLINIIAGLIVGVGPDGDELGPVARAFCLG